MNKNKNINLVLIFAMLWIASRFILICFLVAAAGGFFITKPITAKEGINGHLVDVSWLQKNLNNDDIIILDASPAQIYAAKHIPGAINAVFMMYGLKKIPPAEIEKFYQSWGISPEKKIVLYDQGGTMLAAKQFFNLYYYGFPVENLFILDGGLFKWEEKGLPVTKESTAAAKPSSFKISIKEEANAELPEFLTASGDPSNNVLVEALGADWHFGGTQVFNKAGHIPNAVLLPSSDFFNEDKTFKSKEEISRMLAYLNIKPEQQIYSYCGGGVSACVPYFAIKFIMNYPKVKLYSDSEMGWVQDERDLPYWTYDAPFLMRDTKWLQFWGGKMIRMYETYVSIVDVRPAEIFNQGHIPFALNIPSDIFRKNINDPDKLAEILGESGVDMSQEAVITSGKGLTKEAALAYLMLEKLGQKKVSVLTDSHDKWAQLGYTITTDTTVVGPKKGFGDFSIPPTNYLVSTSKGLIITDPTSTKGLYPKVCIASGANVPTKTLEGKVVHVPYSELLNEDGTPKAAKDIWNILTKAGVPRYAEVVCYSDDPGEAAVNYFILKLMGFPDIKVLVI